MLLTSTLRPVGALSIRVKPSLVAPCCASAAAFSTATSNSVRPTKIPRTTSYPFSASKYTPSVIFKWTVRHNSTASATPPPNSNSSTTPSKLTWNRFLELRRTRRKINVVASSVSAVATTYLGLRVFITSGFDAVGAQTLGLDPLMVTGLSTVGFLAVGWLIGPFFGNQVFAARFAGIKKDIEAKEREFYSRIKRHRVDPTSSSMANPVPDYYGEKIGSVAGYRRWLKDQRAFNLKRGAYMGSK